MPKIENSAPSCISNAQAETFEALLSYVDNLEWEWEEGDTGTLIVVGDTTDGPTLAYVGLAGDICWMV